MYGRQANLNFSHRPRETTLLILQPPEGARLGARLPHVEQALLYRRLSLTLLLHKPGMLPTPNMAVLIHWGSS